MHSIRHTSHHIRKQNYRNIRLEDYTEGGAVGMLARDGRSHQIRWLSFIKREDAVRSMSRPVKLVISCVGRVDQLQGQYLQGCLVEERVYAVIVSEAVIEEAPDEFWLKYSLTG